jgi:hypothetical protein
MLSIIHLLVAGRGIHERGRGEVVAERVAVGADVLPCLHRFPAAVDRRLGLEAGVDAEVVEHPVGPELQQVVFVALLGLEERPGEQPDVCEWKWLKR